MVKAASARRILGAVQIPLERHPHRGILQRLKAYDPRLDLWFLDRIQRWAVVYESPDLAPTPYRLRGEPGCCGEFSRFQLVTTCWAPDRGYLDPTNMGTLLLACVTKNDQRKMSVAQRMDECDRVQQEKKEATVAKMRDDWKQAAHYAVDHGGYGKVTLGHGKFDAVSVDHTGQGRGPR